MAGIVAAFIVGVAISVIALVIFSIFVKNNIIIYKADYKLVYRCEEGIERVLNRFTRYYWKKDTHQSDIVKLQRECSDIRNNVLSSDVFLLSLINENFELDMANVHLVHEVSSTIKPR